MEKKAIIEALISHYSNGNKAKFANLLEVTPQTISTWISRNTFDIDRVFAKCEDVSADWLLTGEGNMLKSENEKQSPDNGSLVPLYNFDAVGGLDSSNDITDSPVFVERYIPCVDSREGDFCLRVTGMSMAPTYPPGSILLLRKVDGWRDYFGYGHTFAIYLKDGRRVLKEVQRYDQDPTKYILCLSHNKNFPAEEMPKDFIKEVYKVIMVMVNEGY